MIAIPWFVLSTTGSATQTGLVAAAEIAPLVVFKALGGPLLDRVGPRRVTLVCDLGSALVVGSIPLLHQLGALTFPLLLVLVAVAGALRGPGDAGKAAMTPEIARVAGVSLERVTGLASAVERTSTMAGAALAGLLVAGVGAANALYVDAASFLRLLRGLRAGRRPGWAAPSRARGRPTGRRRRRTSSELRRGLGLPAHRAGAGRDLPDGRGDQPGRPGLRRGARAGVGEGVRRRGGGARRAVRGLQRRLGARARWPRPRWGETLPRYRTYVVAFLIAGAPRFVVMALESPLWAVFAVTVVAGARRASSTRSSAR